MRLGRPIALLSLMLALAGIAAGCGADEAPEESLAITETETAAAPPPAAPEPEPLPPATETETEVETEPIETAESVVEGPQLPRGTRAVVARIVDGDTLELENGKQVRLAQIDAPEAGQCHGTESAALLEAILPPGTKVVLRRDPTLPAQDELGRLVRYVFKSGTNVNIALVRRGGASVWFVEKARGVFADELLARARAARKEKLGLWEACLATKLTPNRSIETRELRG